MRKKVEKYLFKLKIVFKILFNWNRFVVIHITKEQAVDLILNDKIKTDIGFSYAQMQEFHAIKIIKEVANRIDDIDILCEKATFDAKVEIKLSENKK